MERWITYIIIWGTIKSEMNILGNSLFLICLTFLVILETTEVKKKKTEQNRTTHVDIQY